MYRYLQLAVLVVFSAEAIAWSRYFNNWPLSRRSKTCASEQEVCLQSSQCCQSMTCVKPMSERGGYIGPVSICKNIERELDPAKAWKPSGADCDDSSECQDRCCRVIQGFRGTLQLCGNKDGPFMCVQKIDNQHVVFGKRNSLHFK